MRISDRNPDDRRTDALGRLVCEMLRQKGGTIEWDIPHAFPQDRVDGDERLGDQLRLSGKRNAIRVWRNCHSLIVPRSFQSRSGFADAVRRSPLPVALRKSGGGAVVHGPHILNISHATIMGSDQPFSIEYAYRELAEIIAEPLSHLGIHVRIGEVSHAHCPGKYNIVASGRKIGGTAAFTCTKKSDRIIVTHANIYLNKFEYDLDYIKEFENNIGINRIYKQISHASLFELAILSPRRRR